MSNNLNTQVEVVIDAPIAKVWAALTDPEIIKQYFFSTQVETTWQAGSPIIWKGIWQGKKYEDKGVVLKCIPNKLLETTYWSSMGGLSDSPENYKKVTYELSGDNNQTHLVLTQDNNPTEEAKIHAAQNWTMVLDGLKRLVE